MITNWFVADISREGDKNKDIRFNPDVENLLECDVEGNEIDYEWLCAVCINTGSDKSRKLPVGADTNEVKCIGKVTIDGELLIIYMIDVLSFLSFCSCTG